MSRKFQRYEGLEELPRKLALNIAGKIHYQVCHIVKDHDGVLSSMPFVEKAEIIIDGAEKCLQTPRGFWKKYKPLQVTDNDVYFTKADARVMIADDILMSPYTKQIVPIELESRRKIDASGIVMSHVYADGMMASRSLCKLIEGQAYMEVMNPSHKNVLLPKGLSIGECSFTEDERDQEDPLDKEVFFTKEEISIVDQLYEGTSNDELPYKTDLDVL